MNKIIQKLWLPAIFIGVVFLAFGQSLTHGFAPVDDSFLIVENLAVRGLTLHNLWTVFATYDPELYIPLVFVTYQINYALAGLSPFGFHVFNLILHTANALLVARILFQLSNKKYLALFAGLLFAVHPLHTEAAVWLAGRKDLVAALFFFASFSCYLSAIQGKKKMMYMSILMFLLALLSKVIAVTLLGVIILHALLIEKKRVDAKFAFRFLPFTVLSIVFMGIALGGKTRVIQSVPLWQQMLIAPKSMVFYLEKLFVPVDLAMIYPLQENFTIFTPGILVPLIITIFFAWLAFSSWFKRPWLTFALGWYVCTLAPTFLNTGKAGLIFFAVDRYAYLPSVAFFFAMIHMLSWAKDATGINRFASGTMGVVVLCVAIGLSALQTNVWANPVTLFAHNIKMYPESVGARIALSNIYRRQNKPLEAFEVLKEGLAHHDHALLHYYAGLVYAKTGQVQEARIEFEKAHTMDARYPEPVFSLGSLFEQTGNPEKAIEYFEKTVEMDDSYVVARARLGNLYRLAGRLDEAEEQLQTALHWNASSFESQYGMGMVRYELGEYEQAIEHLQIAVQLQPGSVDSLYYVALSFKELGNEEKYAEVMDEIKRIEPGFISKNEE